LVLCVPWLRGFLQGKGIARCVYVVTLLLMVEVLGVWGAMFLVYFSTTNPAFPR
jgi:hypothetical protein